MKGLVDAAAEAKQRLRAAIDAVYARAEPPTPERVADPTTETARIVEIWQDVDRAIDVLNMRVPYEREGPFYRVSFGAKAPAWPTGPVLAGAATARSADRDPTLVALLDALEELLRALIFEADGAEYTDSHGAARRYLQAAGYVERAANNLVALILTA